MIIQKENGIPIHDTRCTTPRVEGIKKAPAEQRLINQSRVCAQKSLYCPVYAAIEDCRLIEGMILVHAPVHTAHKGDLNSPNAFLYHPQFLKKVLRYPKATVPYLDTFQ